MATDVKIDASWKAVLQEEFDKPYFQAIRDFIKSEKEAGKVIYPPGPKIFNAFNHCSFEQVKVVILGQDPYHGPGQAMGLSFSVPKGIPLPASLKNIYKEIERDLHVKMPGHGDLSSWASQGVFLLNAILTVEQAKAGSHQHTGWQTFTDAVIRILSEEKNGLVFLLWGNFARNKKALIDQSRHHVLEAAHPSPLAGGAFHGNQHFSTANRLLTQSNKTPIRWQIDES